MFPRTAHLSAFVLLSLAITNDVIAEAVDCVVSRATEQEARAREHNASEKEIMALEREACRRIVAGDIEDMSDTILADGGGMVRGREAQRMMFKEFLAAAYEIEFEPTDAFVSESEDMAWAYGRYRLQSPDGAEDVRGFLLLTITDTLDKVRRDGFAADPTRAGVS